MCFRDPAQLGGQILRSGTAGGIEISLDWWDIMIWFQFLTYFQDILYTSYIHVRLVIPIFEAPNWATKTPTSDSVRIALASPICSSTPPWYLWALPLSNHFYVKGSLGTDDVSPKKYMICKLLSSRHHVSLPRGMQEKYMPRGFLENVHWVAGHNLWQAHKHSFKIGFARKHNAE